MVTLEIYRLREFPGGRVMDDAPETVFRNISDYIDCGRVVYFVENGVKRAIKKDAWNYRFCVR